MKTFKHLTDKSALVFALLLLLTVNVVAGLLFTSARLDLTDNSLYTLSQGTKNIVKALDEPLTLRFYFSEKMFSSVPGVASYGQRVKELLQEYASMSNGKLRLIVADPEPFSDEEDQAVQYGLQGVPLDTGGSTAYFGLVGTSATDENATIPFFQPSKEESLEYDVTRIVYELSHPKKRVVGLISSLPIAGAANASPFAPRDAGGEEWFVLTSLKQQFDVRSLAQDVDTIPADVDVLMLVHPKNLSDKTQFAIDQFVLKGGRALVFVDPFSEVDAVPTDLQNPMASFSAPRSSSLPALFNAWGVEFAQDKVVGDISAATRVNARDGMRVQAMDYVAWLALPESMFNKQDFVSSQLKTLNMATAGYFTQKQGATTQFVPLIKTSDKAMSFPLQRFQFGPNPAELLRDYQAGGKELALAARLSGKVKTAFPDGLKSTDGKEIKSGLTESASDINVIVVADTDMLDDKLWVNLQNFFGRKIAMPRANNDAFLLNAVENLSGSNDLISLRSRGRSQRPFEKVAEVKREADKVFQAKEQALMERLRQSERKLAELQRQKDGQNAMILSADQRNEIDKFRTEQVQTRKELRAVRHELSKNIESMGSWLKFINIALIPILVIFSAIMLAIYRNKKMKALAV